MSNKFTIKGDSINKRKLFISQPFKGYPEDYILNIRKRILNKAEIIFDESFELINQYHQPKHPLDDICDNAYITRLYHLGKSIQMMSDADIVIFSKDYYTANDCLIEKYISDMYNMDFYIETDSGLYVPENNKHERFVTKDEFIAKVYQIEHVKIELNNTLYNDNIVSKIIKLYPYSEPMSDDKTIDDLLYERIIPCLPKITKFIQ